MELTASEVWTKIRTDAKSVLPEQTFRTWLSSTEAVSLSDDTLVVAAPTKFAVEWIEDKYGQLLRELSERQLGRVLQLRFEYHGTDERLEFPEIGVEKSPEVAAPEASRRQLRSTRGTSSTASWSVVTTSWQQQPVSEFRALPRLRTTLFLSGAARGSARLT
jgi:chromosomal replication initiation ATPase DnaA